MSDQRSPCTIWDSAFFKIAFPEGLLSLPPTQRVVFSRLRRSLRRAEPLRSCAHSLVGNTPKLSSVSTIGGGEDTTIPSRGSQQNNLFRGIGLHYPLNGWQACPKLNAFQQRVGQDLRDGNSRRFPCRDEINNRRPWCFKIHDIDTCFRREFLRSSAASR